MPSGAPSHNQGDLPQEGDGRLDSTQVEQVERGVGDEIETESLRVELQHYLHNDWVVVRVNVSCTKSEIKAFFVRECITKSKINYIFPKWS